MRMKGRQNTRSKREDAVIEQFIFMNNKRSNIISESTRSKFILMKEWTKRFWKKIAAILLFIGGLGGIAELSGYNLRELFSSTTPSSASVTILVHGENGKDELILTNRGVVKLVYGDAIVSEQINNEGEATFKQVPEHFFQSDVRVEILFEDPKGEPYRAIQRDSLYLLEVGQYISLPVKLHGLDQIFGIVKDFETGTPIDSARVSIQGAVTFSNRYGEYTLNIPPEKQRQFQTIRVFRKGLSEF